MRLLLLLPLFALACASPQQYERGSAVRPPVPAMRPGLGLPRYDRPATQPPIPPRVFAPRSSIREPQIVLGWKAPSQLEGGPEEDELPAYCADAAQEQANLYLPHDLQDELKRDLPQLAKCYAATAWAYCVEGALLQFEAARVRDGKSPSAFWDYKKIGDFVQALVRAECAEEPPDSRKPKRLEDIARKYIWRGPG